MSMRMGLRWGFEPSGKGEPVKKIFREKCVLISKPSLTRLQGAVEEGEGATLLSLTLLETTVKNCGFVVITTIIIVIIIVIIMIMITIIINHTMTQG